MEATLATFADVEPVPFRHQGLLPAMLTIRKTQQDVFRRQARAAFEARAIAHLRRDLAEQTAGLGDDEVTRRVREAIARAERYGLATQRQIVCFVDASFLLGEGFDTDPGHGWAREVLHSPHLAASDKANLLLATACSLYREAAVRR